MNALSICFCCVLAAAVMVSCGPAEKRTTPLVKDLRTYPIHHSWMTDPEALQNLATADSRSISLHATLASQAIDGTVTFLKKDLFNQTFLYGFDLQYSSGADPLHEPIAQAESLGFIPAFFRRLGPDLQLIEDQSRLYESDINHPEQLLVTYHIVQETIDELTVAPSAGSLAVNDAFNGKPAAPGAIRGSAEQPKQAWVRSLQFVPEGQYLLQETGLMLQNGIVQTFMESIFPRASVVPEGYHGLENERKFEPLAARYRFMDSEAIYTNHADSTGGMTRQKTRFAPRFNLADGEVLDWYVTANAPDKFLPLLKSGIEGWNRYFRPQLGYDVMRFVGRLPEGRKIGDPRYNVVALDISSQPGAAYASAAADPFTGLKSHAMIYMPSTWPEADLDESTAAMFGTSPCLTIVPRERPDRSLPVAPAEPCVATPEPAFGSYPFMRFSRQAFMAILLHEVGHALGLAHNYKGSLSFDSSKPAGPGNPTTWSIMDYNYSLNERDAVSIPGDAFGPIYEYDRQMISQLYHAGKDVAAAAPVLPACDDHDADLTEGGVDPLCARFDAESDPSQSMVHSLHNFYAARDAQGSESKTLSQRLFALEPLASGYFADPSHIAQPSQLARAADAFGNHVGDVIAYYVSSGPASLQASLTSNDKAMHLWQDGVPVDEAAFRSRYAVALKEALSLVEIPAEPHQAVLTLSQTVPAAARTAFTKAVGKKIDTALLRLRTSLYPNMKYDPKNPLALSLSPGGAPSQFEELAQAFLATGALRGLRPWNDQSALLQRERKVAAENLATYCSISEICSEVRAKLRTEETQGKLLTNTQLVSAVRALLKILNDADRTSH